MPRFSAVWSIPARFTAVRCPGVARSTCFPPDCTPRTRSRSPLGNNSTSSPVLTLPEISVPVTTEPNPFIAKARSIGSRKYCCASLTNVSDAASLNAFFSSTSPLPVLALTATSGARSRNEPRRNSSASIRTSSSVSASTKSLLVSATTPRFTPSSRQISKCWRVCGLMDSSAAITSNSTSIPAAPASMLLMKRSCPGTSTKPKRTPFSSRKAKPKSIVIPRRFSSARRSGCVPVNASTRADLPWSMCPAVPTMTLFVVALGMMGSAQSSCCFGCYRREESRVKRSGLFRGGDFVDDGLRRRARIRCGKNGPAHHNKIGTCANRLGGTCLPGLIVLLGGRSLFFRPHAGRHDQKIPSAGLPDGARFLHGCHYAIHAGAFRELRQLHHAQFRRAADAHLFHRFLIHARQNRHRKQSWPVRPHRHAGADGLYRCFEHGFSAKRMDVHELHAAHRRRREHGAGNGVGNVVKFQVEEHARAQGRDFFDCCRPCRREELVADFEHAYKIGDLLGELHG